MKIKDINFFDITKSLALIVVLLFIGFHFNNFMGSMTNKNRLFEEQLIEISENALALTGQIPNKQDLKVLKNELREENSQILQEFENQKRKTGETLDEIGKVRSELTQTRRLYEESTKVYDKEGMDEHHYFYKEITRKNKDGKDVKIAWVMFYPNRTEDKRWKFGTFPIKVETTVIESENEDGTYNRYAEVRAKDKNNLEIPIKLDEIKWEKNPLSEKKFYFWNPRIALGMSFTDRYFPELNFSFMSYGRTKRDMDWRFLTLGLGYDENSMYNVIGSFEPFSYNIGNMIPLIENVFIGPRVTYNLENETKYGLGISIPF